MFQCLLVLKSAVYILVGYCFSRISAASYKSIFVGSNYGEDIDPNASIFYKFLICNNVNAAFVTNQAQYIHKKGYYRRGSFKSICKYFSSSACFYTHSFSDIIPYAHKLHWLDFFVSFPPRVFLQHGVIGLKSELSNGVSMQDYIKSLEPTFDFMVVSSKEEKAVVSNFGIPNEKLALTCLPRFDRDLVTNKKNKEVLIFFTWQSSDGLRTKIDEILRSKAIQKLSDAGYICKYALHNMQQGFERDHQNIVNDFDKAVRNCSLLITDDSSVAWDIFYQGQEVIFYKPSNDWLINYDYLEQRKCFNQEELICRVDEFLNGKHSGKLQFSEFVDNNNCQRVLSLVEGRRND